MHIFSGVSCMNVVSFLGEKPNGHKTYLSYPLLNQVNVYSIVKLI